MKIELLKPFIGGAFLLLSLVSGLALSTPEGDVIAKFDSVRAPRTRAGRDLSDKKKRQIARDLMDFTEATDDEQAALRAIEYLDLIETRFEQVFSLIERFSCLKNDEAIAALLGFKPMSSVMCERSSEDKALKELVGRLHMWRIAGVKNGNHMLPATVSKIAAINGYFDFDRKIGKLSGQEKKTFQNRFGFTSAVEDFAIENHWMPQHESRGTQFGYDRLNSALFNRSGLTRVEIPEMREAIFGSEPISWLVYEGGQESAAKKIRGYKLLLRLARLKFNALKVQQKA